MPSYCAQAALLDDVWVIRVAGVAGTASAMELEDVDRIARKFIALNTGTAVEEVEVLVDLHHPAPARAAWGRSVLTAPMRWVRHCLEPRSA